jgi:two-component system chemotaxis response regulator CheY
MSVYEGIRFLVVDDMTTMRKVVSQQLKGLGVSIITEASDGNLAKAALEKAENDKLPIQFIVSDWNMPNMSGIELLKYCRSHPTYKDVAFLLVTAEAEMSQVSEAITAGVDNYVVKPFTPASLGEKMTAVYNKRFKK